MYIKLYEEIKRIIKENYKFLIMLFIGFLVCTIKFPYYIECPGGIINIEERIEVEDGYTSSGSINMAYVSERDATIPTLLIASFIKDWKVEKINTKSQNTTTEAEYFRNHILLEEANQNAIKVAYQKAGMPIKEENTKVYVTYVYEKANIDMQVGDEILEVNKTTISNKKELQQILSTVSKDDILTIVVRNDGKEYTRTGKVTLVNNSYVLGVIISEISKITTEPQLQFKFKKSESGPSGGLMMTLAIYNSLIKEDITKGKKIVGTGTIDTDGNVGQISGVEYKLKGAIKENADVFFVPAGKNYKEALTVKNENNYSIPIIPVNTFDEALQYLRGLSENK